MKHNGYIYDFEKLNVYQKALNFTNEVFDLTSTFKKEYQYSIGDQFRRAALSICNNIAEGSRKNGKARSQFYNYALDSARECVPMISVSTKQNQISEDKELDLRDQCMQICRMLYVLNRSSN